VYDFWFENEVFWGVADPQQDVGRGFASVAGDSRPADQARAGENVKGSGASTHSGWGKDFDTHEHCSGALRVCFDSSHA
jgi:hypothetical protein